MALYHRTERFWIKVRDHVRAKIEIQGLNQRTLAALRHLCDHSDALDHCLALAPDSRDLNSAEVATEIVRNYFARIA